MSLRSPRLLSQDLPGSVEPLDLDTTVTPSINEEADVEVETELRAEVDYIDRPFNLAIAHDILRINAHIADLDQLIYYFHAANDRARRLVRVGRARARAQPGVVPPSLLRSETMLGYERTRTMVGPVSRFAPPHLVRSETMLGDEGTRTMIRAAAEIMPGNGNEWSNIEIEPETDFENEDLTRPVRAPTFRAQTPISRVDDHSQSQEILRAQPGREPLSDMTENYESESVSSEDSDTCVLPHLGRRMEALNIEGGFQGLLDGEFHDLAM
ncbi:hypothetical protein BJX99DRAFT_265200 [Aspergillus californicus]